MLNIASISTFCDMLGCEKPKHPLIVAVDYKNIITLEKFENVEYTQNFYVISLKQGTDCEMKYGRRNYDFSEGSLVFTAPGQVLSHGKDKVKLKEDTKGWMLCIHPDLLKGSSLWRRMPEYSFFDYQANESLHLSDSEKTIIERTVENIKDEYNTNIDTFSRDLLISNLEVLLNYAKRFYNRQFITRTTVNKEVVIRFASLLEEACTADNLQTKGQPSVKGLAELLNYSPNYLSDMLKRETGKTAQEHIKLQILEITENYLLTNDEPIYLIAEKLGFDQPSSFTKFMKAQHGITPIEFRKQNIS